MKKFVGILFAFIGVVLLVAAFAEAISTYNFTRTAERTTSRVVRLNAGGSHPQIEFVAASGETISYAQNGLIGGCTVGDSVAVLYDAQNPAAASIDSFGALYGFTVLQAMLATVFLVVGLFQWIKN